MGLGVLLITVTRGNTLHQRRLIAGSRRLDRIRTISSPCFLFVIGFLVVSDGSGIIPARFLHPLKLTEGFLDSAVSYSCFQNTSIFHAFSIYCQPSPAMIMGGGEKGTRGEYELPNGMVLIHKLLANQGFRLMRPEGQASGLPKKPGESRARSAGSSRTASMQPEVEAIHSGHSRPRFTPFRNVPLTILAPVWRARSADGIIVFVDDPDPGRPIHQASDRRPGPALRVVVD